MQPPSKQVHIYIRQGRNFEISAREYPICGDKLELSVNSIGFSHTLNSTLSSCF